MSTELEVKTMLGAYGRQLEYARRAARLSGLHGQTGLPPDLDPAASPRAPELPAPLGLAAGTYPATAGSGAELGRAMVRAEEFADPAERARMARAARRRTMVERVSREIVENLVFADSKSELVEIILAKLYDELGRKVTFSYPLPDTDVRLDIRIFVQNANGARGDKEVSEREKDDILKRLWRITLATVDQTML